MLSAGPLKTPLAGAQIAREAERDPLFLAVLGRLAGSLVSRLIGYDQRDHLPNRSTEPAISPLVVAWATIASPNFPRR